MALHTALDIALLIIVPSDQPSAPPLLSAERRVSPAWSIEQFKAKLEPVTGIPSSSQILRTRSVSGELMPLDDGSFVGDQRWGLRKGSEIEVIDTRPPAARQNFTDTSTVPKYEMPQTQYEQLSDSVLAWKRRQKLGRFDPDAKSLPEMIEERRTKDQAEITSKGVKLGLRARVGANDTRRGTIRFIGEVEGLGGDKEAGCSWVGIELDEPVGRNDGSVTVSGERKQLFECRENFGVLNRPEKVEVGDWPPLDDLEVDEDMEEI